MARRDRRPRFRKAVYAPREGMTNGCRVLLLRLCDSMNANGVVSVPRSQLADEFGVAPARITENITLAKRLGFLDTVRRGRPGVTAVYQGLIPPPDMVRKPGGDMVRQGVPQKDSTWYATAGSQVDVPERADAPPPTGRGPSEPSPLPERSLLGRVSDEGQQGERWLQTATDVHRAAAPGWDSEESA